MTENSKIEWTDHTFNPWIGCTKVSSGCKNCYAETLMTRKPRWADTWGPQGTRLRTSLTNWRKAETWNRKAEAEGVRYKVFCGSLCDVFEHKANQPELHEWRYALWGLISATPNLDWLLLTKRPALVIPMFPSWWDEIPNNVWIGTSVEDQEQADARIQLLEKTPARLRFLSCVPLLGPIDVYADYGCFDWVIVGGESGPGARPMDLEWARSIRDQCAGAGVPFFMKQVDKKQPIPDDLMIREWPRVMVPA